MRMGLVVVLSLTGLCALAGDEISREALGARTVRFTYEARYTPAAGAEVVELWLPLPREEDQGVRDLDVSGSAAATVVTLAPSGDRVAYLRVEKPSGPVSLRATATVARREIGRDLGTASSATIEPAAFAPDLAQLQFVLINDEVRTIAAGATARTQGVVPRARALYDWVFDHMQYDKSVPGWGLGDIPYCLKVGKGNCTDFHTLFIALARANGIPARWSIGFPLAYGDGKSAPASDQAVAGYHCWAEFYAPGVGWIPVDISEARKHPELKDYFFGHLSGNRVLFTRARDFVLPGDATPRNYLVYPVVRIDGRDATGVEWTFRYSDVAGA
jgi:transglutaminase-like putative cysteine protease